MMDYYELFNGIYTLAILSGIVFGIGYMSEWVTSMKKGKRINRRYL